MDRIQILKRRRETLKGAGAEIRADIAALTDEDSFVELAAFSFSKNTFYDEDTQGEGVVTGFATIGGYPFYIVAQNFAVCKGGLSKANTAKIVAAMNAAEKSATPIVYLLHSFGVQIGEGVHVLEGVGALLNKATRLKGVVPQFAVLEGEVYGSTAALAALADCILFDGDASLCVNSPFVVSAKAGKNLKASEVGGYRALKHSVLPAVQVSGVKDAASKILAVCDLIKIPVIDAELNAPAPSLNAKADAASLFRLFENAVELGANSHPEVKTVLGRLGGIAVAAVIFDKVTLDAENVRKIRNFAEFACAYSLPLITFVDCTGVAPEESVADSATLAEIGDYLCAVDAVDVKLAVVTGKAIGLGYALFAAKSAGFDYTIALATSQIALFESEQGAQIEFQPNEGDRGRLAALYAEENADPFHAAKGGYLDDIVEPQFLKQYLIASLQTLAR